MENKTEDLSRENETELPRAVLVELENVAVKGRQIIFDVLKSVLADKDVKLTPVMFSRYCPQPLAKNFLPDLLDGTGKKRLSEGKLLAEVMQGIKLSLTDGTVKLDPSIKKILKRIDKHGIMMGGPFGSAL